jgi:chemotaxis protein MotB
VTGLTRLGLWAALCLVFGAEHGASAQTEPSAADLPAKPTAQALQELTDEYNRLADSLSGLQQQLQQLRAERSAAVAISPAQAALDSKEVTSALRKQIDAGEVKVGETRQRILLTLPEKSLFSPGQSKISANARSVLKEVAAALQKLPSMDVQVAAHTDLAGKTAGCGKRAFKFPTLRASSVVDALIDAGVPAQRLSAVGYGGTRPIAPNFTGAGRALNRRIEIVLLPRID